MTRTIQVIRLLAAVVIAVAACQFVVTYDGLARIRFSFDHPGEQQSATPPLAGLITSHAQHAFAVPLATLLLGSLLVWQRPGWHTIQEVLVAALWLLSLAWAGLVIIAWQLQNIPIYSGGRFHY